MFHKMQILEAAPRGGVWERARGRFKVEKNAPSHCPVGRTSRTKLSDFSPTEKSYSSLVPTDAR